MTMLSLHTRTGLAGALVLAVLASGGCSESTGPEDALGAVDLYEPPPAQSLYSMQSGSFASVMTVASDAAVGGKRWCRVESVWFDPAGELCASTGQQPPYGDLTQVDGELIFAAGISRAAPFVWTGAPERVNPFPASGDFTVDIRMKMDQLQAYGTGVNILAWNPAETEGVNSPMAGSVMKIWGDNSRDLLRVLLGDVIVPVSGMYAEHTYHLAYEDGAYTLYVDGVLRAGPIPSEVRPSAVWMGNPVFLANANNWTDFRLSQFNVSTPAEEVAAVSLHVKPGGCPSPVNLKGRGVLPVAIAGTSELDIAQIDGATLRLAGVPARWFAVEDVATPVEPLLGRTAEDCSSDGPDGIVDLTAKFSVEELAAALSDAEDGEERTLTLTGNLLPEFGGTPITGEDVVIIRR